MLVDKHSEGKPLWPEGYIFLLSQQDAAGITTVRTKYTWGAGGLPLLCKGPRGEATLLRAIGLVGKQHALCDAGERALGQGPRARN